MKFSQIPLLLLVLFLSIGCSSKPNLYLSSGFTPSQFLAGSSTIEGTVFLRTKSGDLKKGLLETVWLLPANARTQEILKILSETDDPMSDSVSQSWSRLVPSVRSDFEGNFKFQNVPPGPYFIVSRVSWTYSKTLRTKQTGAYVFTSLAVQSGEDYDRILVGR